MVATIDLKPLTEEVIQEMGYNNHDLWMVNIDSTVFGPFETESLKHYVHDNEILFEDALASRADESEWKPFWAYTKFQRRKPQALPGEVHEGPFWIMDFGLKVGPFGHREIDKKIEMGLLGMTDHISVDNGETWLKIYEVAGFDRRTHSPDELPVSPTEASFQKAKLLLVDKLEHPHVNTSEGLAELAWEGQKAGKVIQFKLEELTLKQEKTTEVSPNLSPLLARVGAIVLVASLGLYFTLTNEETQPIVAGTEESVPFYKKPERTKSIKGSVPSPSLRSPASVNYGGPVNNHDSRYPTHIENHDQFQEPYQDQERDPIEGPVMEADQQPQEHSLVSHNGGVEEHSLDAAMNTQPEQPVVEEASDF